MRKLTVLLVMLCLIGVAYAETWQAWTSPDSKYSMDLPSQPEKIKDEGGITLWGAKGDAGLYMVAAVDEPDMAGMDPAKQDELAHFFAEKFFEGAQVKTTSETKIADGYQYVGTMGEHADPVSAQVRRSASQNRIYILLTVGKAESNRLFSSFKAN